MEPHELSAAKGQKCPNKEPSTASKRSTLPGQLLWDNLYPTLPSLPSSFGWISFEADKSTGGDGDSVQPAEGVRVQDLTRTKRPAKASTDDDVWECIDCGWRNTAEDLRCRNSWCFVTKILNASWDSITALPLSAADMMRKSWHEDFTQDSRDSWVRWLVKHMSIGDPAEDIKEMVTDAQSIERNIFTSANSREEYWTLVVKKRSERGENLERKEMKASGQMEMKSMDQTSTLPLPPGHNVIIAKKEGIQGAEVLGSELNKYPTTTHLHPPKTQDVPPEVMTPSMYPVATVSSMLSSSSTSQQSSNDSPDEMMSSDTACDLSTTDHAVTEPLSSVHHSLELQDETDLSSCFNGCKMGESISLPRSHSLPSLIPCLENKTGFRANRSHSLNDVTLLSTTQKITPDIIVEENQESYRFHSTQAGLFQCIVTNLVFKMETEGDVTYRTVPWHRRLLSQLGKRPAGPLFDINASQGSVSQLRFPHCEILSMGAGKFLSVVHVVDDDGIELIYPDVITETHVIINVNGFSAYGIINDVDSPNPVQALVSLFYTPPIDDDDDEPSSILKVLLLPENVVLSEVLRTRRKINGEEIYIEMPQCELMSNHEYTLSTSTQNDAIIILPNKARFKVNESSYKNYNATFVINLEARFKNVRLLLQDSNTSICAWEGYVKLSAAALRKQQVQHIVTLPEEERLSSVRSSFIDRVSLPNINCLVDKLFSKKVLNDAEREMADGMQMRNDKARFVIDTVRQKGPEASSTMIFILCDLDTLLSEHLGLM